MHTGLSFGETLGAMMICGMLCMPQALAQFPDYSTDTDEVDIVTVKNNHCCDTQNLTEASNVEINVESALLATVNPVKIQVMDESNKQVAQVTTRDRVVYMHLPEGTYTIKISATLYHKNLFVEASDETFNSYTI